MHLMYTLDAQGNRLYTLKKVVDGKVSKSAHPARFSPDDKWSRQRVTLKRRFGLLLSQQSASPSTFPFTPFTPPREPWDVGVGMVFFANASQRTSTRASYERTVVDGLFLGIRARTRG